MNLTQGKPFANIEGRKKKNGGTKITLYTVFKPIPHLPLPKVMCVLSWGI